MEGLPQHLQSLLQPEAYPHPVSAVQLVETHVSWVLLTGEFAYKIKRPVKYAFIDLSSRERRAFYCEEELRLNRRFARELYVDTCAITLADGKAKIGGEGEPIEHAVRMRQFDRADELDRLLAAGRITPEELDVFGRYLADIHESLPAAGEGDEWGSFRVVQRVLTSNIEECGELPAVAGLKEPLLTLLNAAEPVLGTRRREGRVRECHGDLHSGNVVRYGGRLIAFDCIEFEPAFRWIDVAEEVAFLVADLQARGFRTHAHAFRTGYLARSGDYGMCRVFPIYAAHRALVRAKVTSLAHQEERHQAYANTARDWLTPKKPVLLLMYGLSGCGKTWLAERLASHIDAIHLRSDVERKRLAGIAEQARSGSGLQEGLYARSVSAQVYERLAQCARDALAGGFNVIVDATFQRRDDRARFRELAAEAGIPVRVIHCRAPAHVLEQRIIERARKGKDASEADLSVLQWQREHFEAFDMGENIPAIDADTTDPDVLAKVLKSLEAVQKS
ncbi:MAG TPA: AAA family ATPase [Steroidobacteraceae bacterium]